MREGIPEELGSLLRLSSGIRSERDDPSDPERHHASAERPCRLHVRCLFEILEVATGEPIPSIEDPGPWIPTTEQGTSRTSVGSKGSLVSPSVIHRATHQRKGGGERL
jgi:hypothetical protein